MSETALSTGSFETVRNQLADTALAIYRSEGTEAITFRRLGRAVGASHMLAYRYFENKEALLTHMRLRCFQCFDQHLRAGIVHATPIERYFDAAIAYVDYVLNNSADYLLMFAVHQPPPACCPELLSLRRKTFDYMVQINQDCIDAGYFQGDARKLTHIGWISLHGILMLQAGNQLVYGCALQDLLRPLMESNFPEPTNAGEQLDEYLRRRCENGESPDISHLLSTAD